MTVIKALLIAGLVTLGLFIIIVWIIPVMTFLVIFGALSIICYVIIKEDQQSGRPP